MEVLKKTSDWDELLKTLNTRNVAFAGYAEDGSMYYAPVLPNGSVDPNPEFVVAYEPNLKKDEELEATHEIDEPVVHEEEELSDVSDIVKESVAQDEFLEENGFKIKEEKYVEFVEATLDVDLTSLVTKLKGLHDDIAKGELDLDEFSKTMLEKLAVIRNIAESDEYVKTVNGYEEFEAGLSELEDRFSYAKKYYQAVKIENDRELVIRDIHKQLYELKDNKELSVEDKNKRALALRSGLVAAKAAKSEAVRLRAGLEAEYKKHTKGNNIVELKNDLLDSINGIDKACRNFDPRPQCSETLGEAIRGTRDEIVTFGLTIIQKQREFDSLCEKYCLEYVPELEKTKTVAEPTKTAEVVEEEKVEKEEEVKVEETAKEEVKEETKAVSKDKGHRVIKMRKAVVAPFISKTLQYGAVGMAAALVLNVGIIPIAVTTGTIGLIGQALHDKLAIEGDLTETADFKNFSNPEELKFTIKGLYQGYKNRRKRLQAEQATQAKPVEPVVEEKVEEPVLTEEKPKITELTEDESLDALNEQMLADVREMIDQQFSDEFGVEGNLGRGR